MLLIKYILYVLMFSNPYSSYLLNNFQMGDMNVNKKIVSSQIVAKLQPTNQGDSSPPCCDYLCSIWLQPAARRRGTDP
jgi:hypothetical protein